MGTKKGQVRKTARRAYEPRKKYTSKAQKTKKGWEFKWAVNPDRMWAGGTIHTKTWLGAIFKKSQMQYRISKNKWK
jgi:hypothetical protein